MFCFKILFFSSKTHLFLFIYLKELERRRESKKSWIHWVTPQMTGAGPDQSRGLELHLGLLHGSSFLREQGLKQGSQDTNLCSSRKSEVEGGAVTCGVLVLVPIVTIARSHVYHFLSELSLFPVVTLFYFVLPSSLWLSVLICCFTSVVHWVLFKCLLPSAGTLPLLGIFL